MQQLRIVTLGISGGRWLTGARFATPAGFPRHDGTGGYAYAVGVWALVHRSRTNLCRAVPNLRVTIRDFCIAAPPSTSSLRRRRRGRAAATRSLIILL
jgi:hypothetical protein